MKKLKKSARRVGIKFFILHSSFFIFHSSGFAAEVDVSQLPPPATNKIDFARDIKPILDENCLRCHGPEKPKNNFRLDNRAAALKGGDDGVDIVPGNSAKSPLIHYVAHLVADSEMPPVGKGRRLTPAQIATLRAWIDQGLVWDNGGTSDSLIFAFSPVLGDTSIGGDKKKFRELNWQPGGLNGGAEEFEFFKQINPDAKLLAQGRAARDDYQVSLSLDRTGLGFIHSGWQQFRKYYDDTGGYDPNLINPSPSLGQDLHLDIGKAWIDFGLAVPNWPRVVFGYEYDYKQGGEATTEWNNVGTNSSTARNLGPASQSVRESVHVLKFDLDYDIKGVTIEDRFRGEFYHLSTGVTNVGAQLVVQSVRESSSYFQGANTLRLEKKFADWLFVSGGYLYSKLNADSALRLDVPTSLQIADLPQITLERESNVGNLNTVVGPFAGFTLSGGAEAEWSQQSGFGTGTYDRQSGFPFGNTFLPFTETSDYDETTVQETATLRFSKIPFTGLFAEARLEQDNIGQFDQLAANQEILNREVFTQHTDFASRASDVRVGFDTSPWRFISMSAHVRRFDNDSDYDSAPLVQPIQTAYPTFIRSRDLNTDEVEARVILHPSAFFKTTLSYQYQSTDYNLNTRPFASAGNLISPGGELPSGEQRAQIYSISATLTPFPRLFLTASLSYEDSTLTTALDGTPGVVPYRGDIYTVLASGTFVLNQNTDLFASYFFSDADYGQNDFAKGLPLGIEYQRHSAQAGLSRRFGKNVSARLQYRFDFYREPSSGGANNYSAHSIYGTLSFQFR
jgi:hypothetical protein